MSSHSMNNSQFSFKICRTIQQATLLENNYKEMLLQGDEVEQRVQLWRKALDFCNTESELGHVGSECQLCAVLHIPAIFSSGTLTRVHSIAHHAAVQHRLAKALGHRFHHFYDPVDIDEQIGLCRNALPFLNNHSDHISPVPVMASLGAALCMRHSVSSQPNDLQEGFDLLSSVVESCPTELHYLADLGELLLCRYYASGTVEFLNESCVILQRAHDLRIGHPTRGRVCRLLATAMREQDEHFGARLDLTLEPLIELYKESLSWQPLGHHSHFEGWNGLGIMFQLRFRRTSNIHDLNHAIHCSQTACVMLDPLHPRAFVMFSNLSNHFIYRYEMLGNFTDFEHALFHARRALDLIPADRRPILLRNLATLTTLAAESSGDIEMLSEAISLAREALGSTQDSLRFKDLMVLGRALGLKASRLGDGEALNEGIHHLEKSLECANEGTGYYAQAVLDASTALLLQYEMVPSQHSHSLTKAIALLEGFGRQPTLQMYHEEALQLTAKAYRARFCDCGLEDDLELALAADQRVLDSRPTGHRLGHRLRHKALAAVSEDLALRDECLAPAAHVDLERALFLQHEALRELKDGHPDYAQMTICLAKLLLIPSTPYTDIEKAFYLLEHTLQDLQSNVYRCVVDLIPVLQKVETGLALRWQGDNPARKQCLEIYQALINLLPRLASLDMSSARRIQVLTRARDLATRASSHAIELMQHGRAVELLEAGRAVFWAQHLRLRSSFASLENGIARELQDISRRLEVTDGSSIPSDLDDNLARTRMERVMTERRRLSARFDELVDQVRSQPGMDRFLRNLDYKALSIASQRGPVVVFQSSWMCVIAGPQIDPHIIPLHKVTNKWLEDAVNALRLSTRGTRTNSFDIRGARKRPVNEGETQNLDEYDILAEIWRRIMQPLVGYLAWKKRDGRERPRLFLCPTGTFSFLPIHAAGIYSRNDAEESEPCCLTDYCVASYTPTLGALLNSHEKPTMLREDVRLLLAAAPEPIASMALPAAREETMLISRIVPTNLILSTVVGDLESMPACTTTAEVLQLLPNATILHLACHGIQNANDPLESGFIMHDKMMQVGDLIRLNLPNARLAFLSACETAQGDMERPDEALHLAATMLYAGFKSVVGTMWSMGDIDGPVVAETVYRELFAGDSDMVDFDLVPYVLDTAVRKLRTRGLEPSRWAPYIHIGM